MIVIKYLSEEYDIDNGDYILSHDNYEISPYNISKEISLLFALDKSESDNMILNWLNNSNRKDIINNWFNIIEKNHGYRDYQINNTVICQY